MSQFANLPQIGTLMLEHTFYEYGEPVLFVCTDQTANRYLCSCCRLSEEWLIAKTCPADLIDVIDDRLDPGIKYRKDWHADYHAKDAK